LSDPKHLLKGSGNEMRHIVLTSAKDIQLPEVEALIASALTIAEDPMDSARRRRILIKAIAEKQRPRRSAR
jgi:hypothetical protein